MNLRDKICLQNWCCLSCPLGLPGWKMCWEYTDEEIEMIMEKYRQAEREDKNLRFTSVKELLDYDSSDV